MEACLWASDCTERGVRTWKDRGPAGQKRRVLSLEGRTGVCWQTGWKSLSQGGNMCTETWNNSVFERHCGQFHAWSGRWKTWGAGMGQGQHRGLTALQNRQVGPPPSSMGLLRLCVWKICSKWGDCWIAIEVSACSLISSVFLWAGPHWHPGQWNRHSEDWGFFFFFPHGSLFQTQVKVHFWACVYMSGCLSETETTLSVTLSHYSDITKCFYSYLYHLIVWIWFSHHGLKGKLFFSV